MRTAAWALVFGLCAIAPAPAFAQQTDPTIFWGATIGGAVPMLAVDGLLFGLAIDAWTNGRTGLDSEWAIFEVVWGAVHVAGVGVAVGVSTLAYDPVPLALTFGVPLGAFGAYFLTHGLLSLLGDAPNESAVVVSCAPMDGGAHMIVSGAF